MSARLDKVLTIPEVAGIAGWNDRRMRRHLLKLNSELGGMLLHNIGSRRKPRWTVTLKALRSVAPAWFTDADTVEARVEALEEEARHLRRMMTTVTQTFAELTAA